MARLYEYQGKELLQKFKISVPKGELVLSPESVFVAAKNLNKPVVVKAQVWLTKRAKFGGIQFAENARDAKKKSQSMFGKLVQNFQVEKILVEEKLDIQSEFYAGIIIDDSEKKPVIIFSSKGGSGIEEIAKKYPDNVAKQHIDLVEGFKDYQARNLIRKTGITGKLQLQLANILVSLFTVAKNYNCRSVEINPLVLTKEGKIIAADCRLTIDDYGVFRHPELGIEIAREFDRPPSQLDKIAYNVEKNDYRGTFYFIQMEQGFNKHEGYVGFHGAGGGGSMMSMDAVTKEGFKIANFTDTSGNPPASKVYRAAKLILNQGEIDGYFGSGSGVASQEQFNSARGLVKAFREQNLSIPAVIRLGGNQEDLAVEILEKYTKDLPAPVEGYKKDDSADFCAHRLRKLVDDYSYTNNRTVKKKFNFPKNCYSFDTLTGTVNFDHSICGDCSSKVCISACAPRILVLRKNLPELAISPEDAKKGKCTECLACELECEFFGKKGTFINLPIAGLNDYRVLFNKPKDN